EVINSDPYGEGWLFKVRVGEDAIEGLLTPEEYTGLTSA
ncbi:MAG: glycine cleavage system protein H, partial [Actinomycetales bacterium]